MPFPTRACASVALAMAVACAALLWHAPAALAQTPHDDADQAERAEVRAVTFRGVKSVKTADLRETIATKPSACLGLLQRPFCLFTKSPIFYERRYFDPLEFRRDVVRLLVFYYRRGWRDARVDTTVARAEDGSVRITFAVTEGPPTIVDTVIVAGLEGALGRRGNRRRTTAGRARLRPGDPLNMLRLDTAVVRIREALLDRGHGNAAVDPPKIDVDTTAHRARVTIATRPGPLTPIARVDVVQLRPEHQVSDETIKNSLTFQAGDLFRRGRVAESQRALYESGLFRSALIDTAVATDAANGRTVCAQQGVGSEQRQTKAAVAAGGAVRDSSKNVVVCVLEGQLHEARVAAGFTTADFFSMQARFTHNYWLSGPRRLDITGAVGNLGAQQLNGKGVFYDVFNAVPNAPDTSAFLEPTYQIGANVRQRWFESPRNTIGGGIFAHRRVSPGVFIDRGYGANAVFTRNLTPRVPLSATYRFEISRVDAGEIYFCVNFGVCDFQTIGALRGQQRLSPFALTGSISTADDPLEPTRGVIGRAEFEHASKATLSDYRYNRLFAEGATYMRVPFRRATLALRGQAGWTKALASTNAAVGVVGGDPVLHPSKRFYAGGSQSVRGYGENELGPRVLTIDPTKFTDSVVVKTKAGADSLSRPACPAATAEQLRACFALYGSAIKDADFVERPLGGTTLLLGSAELRVPIWGPLIGAVFVDAAVLGEKSLGQISRGNSAITPGFGVRYLSPVGPVRVDLGIRPRKQKTLAVFSQLTDSTGSRSLVDLTNGAGCSSPTSPGCRQFPLNESDGAIRKLLDRLTLHLSIGEAF